VEGSIDPIEYDVAELRLLARVRGDRYVADGFLWTELPESLPPTEGTAEYDRPTAWSGSLDERQKPYLRRLPGNDRGERLAMEWIRGLVDRAGAGAAVEALAYYESLGWLTEAVREELEDYLLAVGYRGGGSLEDLTRADHIESLARAARLAQLSDPDAEAANSPARTEPEERPTPVASSGDAGRNGSAADDAGRNEPPATEEVRPERSGDQADGREPGEDATGDTDWNGTVASLGDSWLDAVVSDIGPRPGPDPEVADGEEDDRTEDRTGDGDDDEDRTGDGDGDGDDDEDRTEDGDRDAGGGGESGFEFGPP
jgi:hypothetical protein